MDTRANPQEHGSEKICQLARLPSVFKQNPDDRLGVRRKKSPRSSMDHSTAYSSTAYRSPLDDT